MSFLDEDGNGVIDLSEFVAWWAGTRRLPPPKAPKLCAYKNYLPLFIFVM